jgi:single-strand DNA-binding protein
VAERPPQWVLADGRAHLLADERPEGVLVARCGHPLSRGVLQHERLPSRSLCSTCLSAYLLPEPVFSQTPAGPPAMPPNQLPAASRSQTPQSPQKGPRSVMAGLPEVIFVGILVADPHLTFTPAGTPVATFTVAATDRGEDPTMEPLVMDTGETFLPCAISHQAAENVAASLTKGMRVLVTGVLRQRVWQTSEGAERYAYEVAATEVGASLNKVALRFSEAAPGTTSGGERSGDDHPQC